MSSTNRRFRSPVSIRPLPEEGESILGYLARAARRLDHSPARFFQLLGPEWHRPRRQLPRTLEGDDHRNVRRVLRLSAEQLDQLLGHDRFVDDLIGFPAIRSEPASCPDCLTARPEHWPLVWWSPWHFACLDHARLLQRCSSCWRRSIGVLCRSGCTHSMATIPPEIVQAQKAAAHVLRVGIADGAGRRHLEEFATVVFASRRAQPDRWREIGLTLDSTLNLRRDCFAVPAVTAAASEHAHRLTRPRASRTERREFLANSRTRNLEKFHQSEAKIVQAAPTWMRVPEERTPIVMSRGPWARLAAEHHEQWPEIVPTQLLRHELSDELAVTNWFWARLLSMVLANRAHTTSWDLAAHGSTNTGRSATEMIRVARHNGREEHLLDAVRRLVADLDEEAPTAKWAARGETLNCAGSLRAARHLLDGHAGSELADADLGLWLRIEWAGQLKTRTAVHAAQWQADFDAACAVTDRIGPPPEDILQALVSRRAA